MRTILSSSRCNMGRTIARHQRCVLAVSLTLAGLVLAGKSVYAAINHPPFVSWISDQRISGGGFATQYFRVFDLDGVGVSFTKQSSDGTFYPASRISIQPCTGSDNGCAQDGTGYKVLFNQPNPANDGVTTISIKATRAGGNPSGYTSFTLRKDSSGDVNPPLIGNLQNRALPVNSTSNNATYTTEFVIGDLSEDDGTEDIDDINQNSFTTHSSNTDLVSNISVQRTDQGPRSYTLTATSNNNGAMGVATVWIDLQDPDGDVTTTSFVLQVFAASKAPPSISSTSSTFEQQVLPATSVVHNFTVADNDTALADLKVKATSSNTILVPNDFTNNIVVTQPNSNGAGSVTITPVLPLPTPSPGVPQSATITLSVTDDSYIRQSTFLYVVSDATSPAVQFSRPRGVYSLSRGEDHRPDDNFITGEMIPVNWSEIETSLGTYNWDLVKDVIDGVPGNQQVSINTQTEPCYIAQTTGVVTWCDTDPDDDNALGCAPTTCQNGFLRAVAWDGYLQARRDAFLSSMTQNMGAARLARITVINPNLPGAGQGIRNVSEDFDDMPGYSRAALLGAVQHELRTVQDNFAGKLVQFGFFKTTDDSSTPELWKWLYRDASNDTDANGVHLVSLFDEFNGVKRPRVSFFQENLAATRTSDPDANPPVVASSAPNYVTPLLISAYTFTPVSSFLPSFNYYTAPTNDEYNNAIVFQANTPWSKPFTTPDGLKLTKTINGSPNDAMEGAFNAFLSQYLEVYVPDIDQAHPQSGLPTLDAVLWEGELKSWKDYTDSLNNLAPIEGPAGLTVLRTSQTNNTVSWYPVYGATSYTVQRKILGLSGWTTISCSDPAATQCLDTGSTGLAYAYRVQAAKGANNSLWSYVAVFLSENSLDGFVKHSSLGNNPINNSAQPGIRAGEANGIPLTHERGFVSFTTSLLTSSATILDAKLRLNQATSGGNFALLGPCMVDVKQGSFNNNAALEGADYDAAATTQNAFPVTNVGLNNWYMAEMPLSTAKLNISNTDHTQFRIYFAEGTVSGRFEGWYSGESSGNNSQPQLIVRYYTP